MKKVLVVFMEDQDIRSIGMPMAGQSRSHHGTVWAIEHLPLDEVVVVYAGHINESNEYVTWLKRISKKRTTIHQTRPDDCKPSGWRAAVLLDVCKKMVGMLKSKESLFVFVGSLFEPHEILSINKTLEVYFSESQKQVDVRICAVPCNDSIYNLMKRTYAFEILSLGLLPVPHLGFESIIYKSNKIEELVVKAKIVAQVGATVLIQGESGTGKELLARAIHKAGPRYKEPFVAVNCGAIPSELVESEFFGHIKGSFTGAVSNRDGYFKCANNGTLFLDEIGELPLAAQVKILRVIQEGELTPVGATQAVPVNVRIVAATNRLLAREVAHGRFRGDLFYRLAVAILDIPPLRDRIEDIDPLVDHILKEVGDKQKMKIHSSARTLLKRHRWPGNVRELQNTVYRATLWSGNVIMAKDIQEALLADASPSGDQVFDCPFTSSFELQSVLDDVARHYLARAIKEAGGNKTKAAKMLGFKNQQTLTNWLKRTGVEVR